MNFWTIPQIWEGTVFILGGGPSLKNADLTPLKGKRVIGVNESFTLGCDVCWFGDARWYHGAWKRPHLPLRDFSGLIVTCCNQTAPMPGVLRVKRGKPTGIETRKGFISWNRSSGASAINLAAQFGAKRIVLLGFDMKCQNGQPNWHDRHSNKAKPKDYTDRFLPVFPDIARDLNALGIECLNANPDSAIGVFPKVRLEDLL